MNLSAVYELQNRLEMAAVAGVNLISEDFRLKRAVEQMASLAGLSPVFQKIYGLSVKLISPECEDLSGLLLDTLALVEAVCVTQGSLFTGGEMEPIPEVGKSVCQNFPYSVMAPVVEAFQGTGSGRYAAIRDAHEATPELFNDYRIEGLMVQALNDSYGELADMVEEWLIKKGESILPSLKEDFKPDGKRDMARRLHIIEAVAGRKENEFYRSLLKKEEVSKEVKEAAILALRHENGNESLLLDLLKTEKGKMKEGVLNALSYLDGPETKEYWSKVVKKKPVETASYLANSKTEWASDLIADAVAAWVEEYKDENLKEKLSKLSKEQRQEDMKKRFGNLSVIWSSCVGKHSEKLCQCYEMVYCLIPEKVPEVLVQSLIVDPHPDLCQVTRQMYENHKDAFGEPFAVMLLLTESKEAAYERLKQEFETNKNSDGIFKALEHIFYDQEDGFYEMRIQHQVRNYQIRHNKRRMEDGLDFRWYSLLLNSSQRYEKKWRTAYSLYRNRYDAMVARLYRPSEELKERYGAYFYEKALRKEVTIEGLRMMKQCGWTNYKGILAAAVEKNSTTYYVHQILLELPLSSGELADELDRLIQRYAKQAVNGIGIWEKWRDDLRNGQTVKEL